MTQTWDGDVDECVYSEVDPDKIEILTPTSSTDDFFIDYTTTHPTFDLMSTIKVSLPLPVLPQGWAGENDFKVVGQLSPATQRNLEPVGPHFLAHARRVRRMRASDPRIYS